MGVQLRDYQADLIERARAAMRRSRRVLLQAPTGAGKTALASHMAGAGARTFFICHRAELVAQTSFTFRKFGIQHSFVASGLPCDTTAKVFVCSIDTLKNRLHALPVPKLLIWDECHHLGAAGWQRVQEHYPESYHVGLSATPVRLDGKGLDAHFDELVPGPSVEWLIDQGHLSPYRAFAPSAPDMGGVRRSMGDYAKGETEKRMDKPKLIGDAIDHWRRLAGGARTVGFAVTVAHSQHMAAQFNAAGIPAAHLDGGTPKAERKAIIEAYADGRVRVLFNVDLFGEGFDLSAIAQRDVTIDCVLQMRPTQSLGLHLQQVGRALRPAPGKVAIILDHAGNIQRHGLPDDPREWSLEGRERVGRAGKDDGPLPPVTCTGCFNQIRRPAPPDCPHCGARLAPEAKAIEFGEGELKEITAVEKTKLRLARAREQAEAKSLQDLVALAAKRGYKSPQGWAFKVWSNRRNPG